MDSANKGLADDPGASQIPLDGLRKAVQHRLADEPRLSCGRSCQEHLNITLHRSTERRTSPQFRRHAGSKSKPGEDLQTPQKCLHRVPPSATRAADVSWSDQDSRPAFDRKLAFPETIRFSLSKVLLAVAAVALDLDVPTIIIFHWRPFAGEALDRTEPCGFRRVDRFGD